MKNLSSATGYKPWAWLNNEQQLNVISQIEKGILVLDGPCKCQTRHDLLDEYYTFLVHSDDTITVTKRK